MQFNRDFLVSLIRHLDKYNPAPTITGELVGQPIQDGQHSTLTMTIDVDSRVENDPRKAERELFANAPYIQPGTY